MRQWAKSGLAIGAAEAGWADGWVIGGANLAIGEAGLPIAGAGGTIWDGGWLI